MSQIIYQSSIECGQRFESELHKLIAKTSITEVCDLGGGANPILSEEFIKKNQLTYSLLDVSQTELDKAPAYYDKYRVDLLQAEQVPTEKWDLVFSQTLAEHLENGKLFHENVFRSLKPGGYAIHLFPTLFAIPFLVNKFLPEKTATQILKLISNRDLHQHGKFPAYYSWCFGPTQKMIKRLGIIGYEVTSYQGLFGHRYYKFFNPLYWLHTKFDKFLLKFPCPYMTSYSILVLRKPNE